ncbi:MAG: MscL family protein [Chloroflexota bacterium]
MSMLKEFREFLTQGRVMDLAVAVIIGAASQAVINSLVNDVIMPIVGSLFGQPDYSSITWGPVLIGNFLNAELSFIAIAASVFFFVIKPVMMAREKLSTKTVVTAAETAVADLGAAYPGASVKDAGNGRVVVQFGNGSNLTYDYLKNPVSAV